MKTLSKAELKADSQAFILRLEDEVGEALEFVVTADQLEDLLDEADALLGEDDAEFDTTEV